MDDINTEQVGLAIEPLLDLYRNDDRYDTIGKIAEAVGASKRSIGRWLEAGIPIKTAERIADTIGLHPVSIWGADYHVLVYYEMIRDQLKTEHLARKAKIRMREKRKNATKNVG